MVCRSRRAECRIEKHSGRADGASGLSVTQPVVRSAAYRLPTVLNLRNEGRALLYFGGVVMAGMVASAFWWFACK